MASYVKEQIEKDPEPEAISFFKGSIAEYANKREEI